MKRFLIYILPLVFISLAFGQESKSPVALVQKVVKDVQHQHLEMDWEDSNPGIPLKDGEKVKTGIKSLALIKFLDGSLIRVREKTELDIYGKKDGKAQNTNTVLASGEINFDVKKQGDDEFTFTTPTGIASIRGTGGFIQVPDETVSIFILETGIMELTATQGAKNRGTLTAGKTAKIGTDGNVDINDSTQDDLDKLKKSKMTKVKKIIIETEDGFYEIEYLDDEQN